MLSSVLHSDRASRGEHADLADLRPDAMLISSQELAKRLDQLEARIERKLAAHDKSIAAILAAICELMNPPASRRRGIGFTADIGER